MNQGRGLALSPDDWDDDMDDEDEDEDVRREDDKDIVGGKWTVIRLFVRSSHPTLL